MLARCMRYSVFAGRVYSFSSLSEVSVPSSIDTETKNPTPTEASIPQIIKSGKPATSRNGSLGGWLLRLRNVDSISVAAVIAKWKEEGHDVSKRDFIDPVRRLMNLKRYDEALLICDSSLEQKELGLTQFDYASHLRLVFKVRGLCSAEMFYEGLPEGMRDRITSRALLHIFVENGETAKAEVFMEKMEENGIFINPLSYIHLMCLYFSKGQFDKAEGMMEKAKNKCITQNSRPSYNTWLIACATQKNIQAAEAVFSEMKKFRKEINWMTYSILAGMYIKHNLFEKAGAALKDMEKVTPFAKQRKAYFSLISMNACMGNKDEVLRIWDDLDLNFGRKTDDEYSAIVTSLLKLDLFEKAQELMAEWKSVLKPGKHSSIYSSTSYHLKNYGKNWKTSVTFSQRGEEDKLDVDLDEKTHMP